MRKTLNCDDTQNAHIRKLELLYNVNPWMFYSMIDNLMKHPYAVGLPEFSHKTECVRLPDREKIYPATVWQPYYELYILDDQKELLNPESLKKHIDLITGEKRFPHILIITSVKNQRKIQEQVTQYLPEKTDDMAYTIAVITNTKFNRTYARVKQLAYNDTSRQLILLQK